MLGEDTGPDGRGNGETNGTTNVGEHGLDGKDDGNELVRGGSHDSHLLANDEGTTSCGNKDLAHDNVADVLVRLTEMDHETDTENGDRDTKVHGEPLEATSLADGPTDEERPEAGADGVNVDNVAGLDDVKVVDNLEERGEVRIPDVEGDEEGTRKDTRADDGAVHKELVGDEGLGSEELLVEGESDHEQTTKDEEADDEGGLPLVLLVRVEVERQEEQGQTSSDEEQAENVKLDEVELEGLPEVALALMLGEKVGLLGLDVVLVEEPEQGRADARDNNGKGAITPPPARALEEALSDDTADPAGDDVGGRNKGKQQSSVLEGRSIGEEDGDRVGDAVVSDPVEDLGSSVGLDTVTSSHHDETNGQAEKHGAETLRTTPDIEDLGERELEQTTDQAGHDAGGGRQGVEVEGTGNVRVETGGHAGLEGIDEVEDPDTGDRRCVSQSSHHVEEAKDRKHT